MKLGVCIPYRNREEHLHTFVPRVGKYLKNQGIDFQMYFVHQVDDKLFNRGATKNIGAKHAFEEGCDYIVWHDIDMIPEEGGGCDYSYPEEAPRHIATKIEQMDWQLKYHEYFGGAILFTKEQVEATNGYSNDYWDWGMEDDDLFWRCHQEGLTNSQYLDLPNPKQKYLRFNGVDSYVKIPFRRPFNHKSHTISILVRAQQIIEKNPTFLIGDKQRKYVEYPILSIPGYDYGLSFNNSRALTLTYWNNFNEHNYMWVKRYDNQWSWLTAVFDDKERLSHLYLNGTEVDSKGGYGSPSPYKWKGILKKYKNKELYLGHTPTDYAKNNDATHFKGDIAQFHVWDRALPPEDLKTLHQMLPTDGLIISKDFNYDTVDGENLEIQEENIILPNSILPYRVDGRMSCLPHEDEGIVGGVFKKGETTAANERRYVLEMQQGKIDYKKDGIKQVQYELVGEEKLTPWAKMINIKL